MKASRDLKTAVISIERLSEEALPALTDSFNAVPGVQSVDFSVERSVAVVEFDATRATLDDLLRAVICSL